MHLSTAIGFPLMPSSERNVLNHSRFLKVVAPKARKDGARGGREKEDPFEFM